MALVDDLKKFMDGYAVKTKGPLACVLFITRRAKDEKLPLKEESLRTDRQGQVRGLGREPVQKILADHGITKVLAEEGGRTSRGSLGLAEQYLKFINDRRQSEVEIIESWWIDRVRDLWRKERLKISLDLSNSLSAIIAGILQIARDRQRETPGGMVEGTVLQHLVGAKLDIISGKKMTHHSASTADSSSSRSGDFQIGTACIHVTVTPSERMMSKCKDNLNQGLRPIIVCPRDKVEAAKQLAEIVGIDSRVEIFPAEEFISVNINELARFDGNKLRYEAEKLIHRYNEIVGEVESDPSLQIEER